MYVCQLCLTKSSEKFYSFNYGKPSIQEKLGMCIPNLERNMLAFDAICMQCYNDLGVAYEFYMKCMSSQNTIKNLIVGTSSTNEELRDLILAIVDNKGKDPFGTFEELKPDRKTDVPVADLLLDMTTIKKEIETPVETMWSTDSNMCAKTRSTHSKFRCKKCLRQYDKLALLQKHMKMHCKKINYEIRRRRNTERDRCIQLIKLLPHAYLSKLNEESNMMCQPIVCLKCNITLHCHHQLKFHNEFYHDFYKDRDIHFSIRCNTCNFTISHKYLKLHLDTHGSFVKLIDIFQTVIDDEAYLIQWKCLQCQLNFTSCRKLSDHNVQYHSTRMITCTICGDQYNERYIFIHKKSHLWKSKIR